MRIAILMAVALVAGCTTVNQDEKKWMHVLAKNLEAIHDHSSPKDVTEGAEWDRAWDGAFGVVDYFDLKWNPSPPTATAH